MAADPNIQADLKVRYGEFENPLPEDDSVTSFFKFVAKESRDGRNYNWPVQMTLEHGQTADVTGTAYALNPAIDANVQEATLTGFDYTHIANVSYSSLLRGSNGASKSGSEGGAFWEPFDLKVDNMMQAANLYRELWTLYGCGTTGTIFPNCNIGVINALVGGSTNLSDVGGAFVDLRRSSWIPGLWPSMINAKVDIYNTAGTAIVAGGTGGDGVTVTGANSDLARIRLFKTGSTVVPAVNMQIVPFGWGVKTCIGVFGILSNTGILFNIDASIYPVWKPIVYNVGTALATPALLTRAKILQLAARLFPNGLRGGATLFVSAPQFADLAEEIQSGQGGTAPQQHYTDSVGSRVVGLDEDGISFRSSIGTIKIKTSALMKQGFAMLIGEGLGKRIGASDITFRAKGSQDWFHNELPNNAGSQLRCISNQAPIVTIPYRCALLQFINATGDVGTANT